MYRWWFHVLERSRSNLAVIYFFSYWVLHLRQQRINKSTRESRTILNFAYQTETYRPNQYIYIYIFDICGDGIRRLWPVQSLRTIVVFDRIYITLLAAVLCALSSPRCRALFTSRYVPLEDRLDTVRPRQTKARRCRFVIWKFHLSIGFDPRRISRPIIGCQLNLDLYNDIVSVDYLYQSQYRIHRYIYIV